MVAALHSIPEDAFDGILIRNATDPGAPPNLGTRDALLRDPESHAKIDHWCRFNPSETLPPAIVDTFNAWNAGMAACDAPWLEVTPHTGEAWAKAIEFIGAPPADATPESIRVDGMLWLDAQLTQFLEDSGLKELAELIRIEAREDLRAFGLSELLERTINPPNNLPDDPIKARWAPRHGLKIGALQWVAEGLLIRRRERDAQSMPLDDAPEEGTRHRNQATVDGEAVYLLDAAPMGQGWAIGSTGRLVDDLPWTTNPPKQSGIIPLMAAVVEHDLLPLGLQQEESHPYFKTATTRWALSPNSGKLYLLMIATALKQRPRHATLEELTHKIRPGQSRYQRRDYEAMVEAAEIVATIRIPLREGGYISPLDIRTCAPDPSGVVSWSLSPFYIEAREAGDIWTPSLDGGRRWDSFCPVPVGVLMRLKAPEIRVCLYLCLRTFRHRLEDPTLKRPIAERLDDIVIRCNIGSPQAHAYIQGDNRNPSAKKAAVKARREAYAAFQRLTDEDLFNIQLDSKRRTNRTRAIITLGNTMRQSFGLLTHRT
jgi:hypothetical protein